MKMTHEWVFSPHRDPSLLLICAHGVMPREVFLRLLRCEDIDLATLRETPFFDDDVIYIDVPSLSWQMTSCHTIPKRQKRGIFRTSKSSGEESSTLNVKKEESK